ncbi:MAG: outer membrane beta-barrel family protein [Saprospiraceae bacterium]|nr:outer membrane beta-barrel family protein [Saprospiraceae bacterium]
MRIVAALLFVVGQIFNGWSQTHMPLHYLTARVTDAAGLVVEIGNIHFISRSDSTFISGDVFYEGNIETPLPQTEGYLVVVSALGYQSFTQAIPHGRAGVSLGDIRLEPQSLSTIEVRASRNVFKRTDQGAVVQVAGTPMSNAGTALDALRNTPLVFLNSANQASVVGKGTALLYVDGQLIGNAQMLSGIGSDEIQEIEILQHPPAKYDAAGNAIINIKTKRKYLAGHRVGFLQEVGKGRFWRGYAKANGYVKSGQFLLQGSYGIRPWAFTARNDYGRTFRQTDGIVDIVNSYRYQQDILAGEYVAKATWLPDAHSRIGIHVNGTHSDADRKAQNTNFYAQDSKNVFDIGTDLSGPTQQHAENVNVFFDRTLDSMGSNIFVSGQYSAYALDRREDIAQLVSRGEGRFLTNRRSINSNDIRVTALQADLAKHFVSGPKATVGFKFSQIDNLSALDFSGMARGGEYFNIPALSTHYDYKETILAAYVQLSGKVLGLDVSAGLRSESTGTEGLSGADGDEQRLFASEYWNLFPSVSIGHDFESGLRVSAGYNYRIARPAFQDLNPFTIYVDSLVSFVGNPQLLPEYAHSSNLTFSRNGISLSLDHVFTKDKINTVIEVADPENPALFQFVRDNIVSTNMFSGTLSFSVNKGRYSSFYSLVGRVEDHRYRDGQEIVSNAQPGYYIYTSQGFRLPGGIQAEVTLQYTSKRVDGLYLDDPISALGFSLTRRFMSDRLTVRLIGNDILDDYKFIGTAEFFGNDWTYLSRGDWQYLKVAFNWNFGKLSTGQLSNRTVAKSELSRIRKQ